MGYGHDRDDAPGGEEATPWRCDMCGVTTIGDDGEPLPWDQHICMRKAAAAVQRKEATPEPACPRCGLAMNITLIKGCKCYGGGQLAPSVYAAHALEVERTNLRGAIRRTLEERARDRMSAVVGAMLAGAPEHEIPGLPAEVIADACLAAAAELRGKRRIGP